MHAGPPRGGGGGGQLGHFALGPTLLMGPKRSIYSNRTVKYSIKAVTTCILPWAPQALSAALHACELLHAHKEKFYRGIKDIVCLKPSQPLP